MHSEWPDGSQTTDVPVIVPALRSMESGNRQGKLCLLSL